MAKPKTRSISIRLSEDEESLVVRKASEEMRTVANYIKKVLMDNIGGEHEEGSRKKAAQKSNY